MFSRAALGQDHFHAMPPFGIAHVAPSHDFISRAQASKAKPGTRVDRAHLVARARDGDLGEIVVHFL